MSIIVAKELTRRYGRRRGVERLNLSIPEGSLYGFLGPNGAGKTTAIRVLLGFLRPSAGEARIFGMDCWRHSHRVKREVGYLPGDLRLYSGMNGDDALRIFGAARGRDLRPHGRTLAEMFALDLRVKVRSMSRGMRQKLGLVLAMAHQPRLLILDEPSSALDPLMQTAFRSHLRELAAGGCTILFSSHTLSEVEELCDRVAIVREGRLVFDQTLDSLRAQAGHEVVIHWRDAAVVSALAPPVGLTVHQQNDRTWRCMLQGPIEPLLEWLSGKPVEDISIGRPDLESLFRGFFARQGNES